MIHRIQSAGLGVFMAVGLLCNGCGKSTPSPASDTNSVAPTATLHSSSSPTHTPALRLHWIGKKRLAAESNATNFMAIWNLPESARLEAQTLTKLATAPWRLWATNTMLSNAPSAQLRPLLEDLVREEVYLEARGDTNHLHELVLALHLPADRAALWQTNLPLVLQSLFGSDLRPQTSTSKSDFKLQTPDLGLELVRAGEWTLLSFASGNQTATLLTACRKQIAVTQTPFQPRPTDYWVDFKASFAALPRYGLLRGLVANLPTIELKVTGEEGNVRTSGELVFPRGAPIEMEPWNIPTNLVHDPLIGFMAVRGFRPVLEGCALWDASRFGPIPNQVTFWAQAGISAAHFFAFPCQSNSDQILKLNDFIIKEINPRMALFPNTTNVPLGLFEPDPDGRRLRWRGLPYIMPNLDVVGAESNLFITGGLFANRITNRPAPQSLKSQFDSNSNLILYDWELSNPSAHGLIQVSQALRFVFGRNRLSITNNASLPWLVTLSSNLVSSSTSLRLQNSNSISIYRASTIGLTSVEIHILAEWLESPSFPLGLFSLMPRTQP